MPSDYFEEEDFSGRVQRQTSSSASSGCCASTGNGWPGFMVTIIIVSILDAYFTFLSKQIIDEGILQRRRGRAGHASSSATASMILVQAAGVFAFIYLAGVLGERVRYDLRQHAVQPPADAFAVLLQPHAGGLDHERA